VRCPDSLAVHESRYELVAAGMLIMAGGGNGTPLNYDELERWTRIGNERGMRLHKGRAVKPAGAFAFFRSPAPSMKGRASAEDGLPCLGRQSLKWRTTPKDQHRRGGPCC
jgi:hypothetical protein